MKWMWKCGALAVVLCALILPGYADAVFTLGNHPQPNEENILFKMDQTGSVVTGFTNQSNTEVTFSSTTDTLVVTSAGQAKVTAQDGLVNDITIAAPGLDFQDFILNPFKPANDGDLTVTVLMTDGSTFSFTYGDVHGNNFLTITTSNNESISSVTVDSAGGFQDLRQPRISGLSGVVLTPEPSTLSMLGGALVGVAGLLRRRLAA